MTKSLYFNNIQLKTELDRCLNCATKPCKNACPLKCDPQYFIKKAKENNFDEAAKSIYQKNPFGKTCGLICPEHLCMKACVRGKIDSPINIPKIQATLIEKANIKNKIDIPNTFYKDIHVAIIGSGPAGLMAAITLAKHGIFSTLFEEKKDLGGAINLIPEDRLPKKILQNELECLLKTNAIKIKTNSKITSPQYLLQNGFSHIIVATGEDEPHLLNIKGEENCTPYDDFLNHPEKFKQSKKVAIIGGGNVAFDCAHISKKLDAQSIDIFIRRRSCDMRLTSTQYLELIQNKVNINPLYSPIEIKKQENKLSLIVVKNNLSENSLIPLQNQIHHYDNFDIIIKAIGSKSSIQKYEDSIFYAGDCKKGSSSVIEALADGQTIAINIINSLLK